MREYRIVRDRYLGYEVQCRSAWWPFWHQPGTNTHCTVEKAEKFARELAINGGVVKYLGTFKPLTQQQETP